MQKNILSTFPGMKNRQDPRNGHAALAKFVQQNTTAITLNDTDDNGRLFMKGRGVSGFDSVIVRDGKIVTIFNSTGKEKLSVGDFVQLQGDSTGYIGSGHGSGEMVTIIDFAEPFQGVISDNIIKVIASDGKTGFIKPSNIFVDTTKDFIRVPLKGYNGEYSYKKNTIIGDLMDRLNTICCPYESGITVDGILELNPQMPEELRNQAGKLAQQIVIEMQSL